MKVLSEIRRKGGKYLMPVWVEIYSFEILNILVEFDTILLICLFATIKSLEIPKFISLDPNYNCA
jgi:hypothetical protein